MGCAMSRGRARKGGVRAIVASMERSAGVVRVKQCEEGVYGIVQEKSCAHMLSVLERDVKLVDFNQHGRWALRGVWDEEEERGARALMVVSGHP